MKKFFKYLSLLILCFVCLSFSACQFFGNYYVYEDEDKYVLGSSSLDGINSINIDWISGKVQIFVDYESDYGYFLEEYSEDLKEEHLLHYYKDGSELNIKFAQSGANLNNINLNKTLKICLNKDMIDNLDLDIDVISADVSILSIKADEVDIESISGNVKINMLKCNNIDIETISGNVDITSLFAANECDIDTTSGNIKMDSLFNSTSSITIDQQIIEINKVKIETVSGDVDIRCYDIKNFEFDSVSGKLKLDVLKSNDFTYDIKTVSADVKIAFYLTPSLKLTYKTTSGTFDSAFLMLVDGDDYIIGEGKNVVKVNTTSGNLEIDGILLFGSSTYWN